MTNSSPIFVRLATQQEEQLVAQHVDASINEASRYRGSLTSESNAGEQLTWVAGVGDSVCASATVQRTSATHWHVSHIYVIETARDIGLGDALLEHILARLTEMKAQWISAQALPGDRAMKNLFERHGLIAQSITVGKSLNDPSN